jgi:hypothetical protein
MTNSRSAARLAAVGIAFGALALTSACIHVSQRAWQNGRGMTSSWQYRAVMSGDVNRTTLQGMYWSSSALNVGHRSLPYQPFGYWYP